MFFSVGGDMSDAVIVFEFDCFIALHSYQLSPNTPHAVAAPGMFAPHILEEWHSPPRVVSLEESAQNGPRRVISRKVSAQCARETRGIAMSARKKGYSRE